jgi:hypothetical protein
MTSGSPPIVGGACRARAAFVGAAHNPALDPTLPVPGADVPRERRRAGAPARRPRHE